MSETILTKGWAPPKGKCDICREKPATYWFGDTSVALCGDEACAKKTQDDWDRMLQEQDDD